MTSSILLTGGTGTLGRLVVRRLRDHSCDVRVLSRSSRESGDSIEFMTGDLGTGEGIQAAVDGVGTIVHLAGSAKGDADKARNLVRAASQAGAQHLVYISVVGADRIPVPLPAGFRVQPIDAGEVATRVVELTLGEPSGLVPDMGGPRVYDAAELLRGYLRASKRRRPIVPVPLPGKAARAFRDGANLAPGQAVGHRTWEEFLADRTEPSRNGAAVIGGPLRYQEITPCSR